MGKHLYKLTFALTFPMLLFWGIGFAFETAVEVTLPAKLGLSIEALALFLLGALYLGTLAIYGLFPRFRKSFEVEAHPYIVLRTYVVTALQIYVAFALPLAIAGFIASSVEGELAFALLLMAAWAPLWIAMPGAAILAPRRIRRASLKKNRELTENDPTNSSGSKRF